MSSLQGKLAFITGASRGIGQAVALELGAMGATVAGTATTEAGAQQITRLLGERGITGRGFVLDVAATDESRMQAVLEDVQTQFERVYALVNNCLLYTSPSPRDGLLSRMPSSA